MGEINLMREIQLRASALGARLFRNNVGVGWAGKLQKHDGSTVTLKNARPLHAGLCEGSSDLIGWQSVEITSDMVGTRVAVFFAVEVKSDEGRATVEQLNFLSAVREAGGYSTIARSLEDLAEAFT